MARGAIIPGGLCYPLIVRNTAGVFRVAGQAGLAAMFDQLRRGNRAMRIVACRAGQTVGILVTAALTKLLHMSDDSHLAGATPTSHVHAEVIQPQAGAKILQSSAAQFDGCSTVKVTLGANLLLQGSGEVSGVDDGGVRSAGRQSGAGPGRIGMTLDVQGSRAMAPFAVDRLGMKMKLLQGPR